MVIHLTDPDYFKRVRLVFSSNSMQSAMNGVIEGFPDNFGSTLAFRLIAVENVPDHGSGIVVHHDRTS